MLDTNPSEFITSTRRITRVILQVSGGRIAGTVTDQQKAVLPGVTVTIQGTDRTQTAGHG